MPAHIGSESIAPNRIPRAGLPSSEPTGHGHALSAMLGLEKFRFEPALDGCCGDIAFLEFKFISKGKITHKPSSAF